MTSPSTPKEQGKENKQPQETCSKPSPLPRLPAPPEPENDSGIVPPIKSPPPENADIRPEEVDIYTLPPVAALKMLCRNIDALVLMTGDVPPTPPVRTPEPRSNEPATTPSNGHKRQGSSLKVSYHGQDQIDGVTFIKTPIGSPEAHPHEPTIIGADAQPVQVQHGAIARKFYSKRPPPITTEDYLMRMHKYCPMSTAVYLATSSYINRMAVHDKLFPVTPRNVHRLLLAGLRVAMKALEDLSWPHARFSKVGGVSEGELGRLEITFCFLMEFSLKVDEAMLTREAESLARQSTSAAAAVLDSPVSLELKLPSDAAKGSPRAEKRKASSTLPSRPVVQVGKSIEVMGQS